MTTGSNEACIGCLDENCYFMGEGMTFLLAEDLRRVFLVGKTNKFLAIAWNSPPSPGFPIKIYGDNSGR